jgi:hypothetical protein
MVLYGASDIFADGTEIVRSRFPQAIQVTLQGSGHVHWLQNPSGYADALGGFYGRVLGSPEPPDPAAIGRPHRSDP